MVEIKPIEEHQIEQAKQVVLTVSLEIWQGTLSAEDFKRIDPMSDLTNVKSHYFDNNGLFLVLIDFYLRDYILGKGKRHEARGKRQEARGTSGENAMRKPYRAEARQDRQ